MAASEPTSAGTSSGAKEVAIASYDFSGKRALVTGAGKGIGRDVAKALVACNAEVIALSRTESDLTSLEKELPGIKTICVDLRDLDATLAAVKNIGSIHLLVNNAGVAQLLNLFDVTVEAYNNMMDINVKAPLFLTQAIAKGMVDRGEGGAVVNVSSVSSLVAGVKRSVYSSSKAALDMLTKVMGMELGKHNIRVNAVNPTVVLTDLGRMVLKDPVRVEWLNKRIPLGPGRLVEISDVTDAILFLLSDKAASINCITLPLDGGLSAC